MMLETLMNVSRYGVEEFESFKNIIDGFRQNVVMNLKRMQLVRESLEKHN